MSDIIKHANMPLLPRPPQRKPYFEKLEAKLVCFAKSLVPALAKNMLSCTNSPSIATQTNGLSNNKKSSGLFNSIQLMYTPEEQLYLVWLPTDGSISLGPQPIISTNHLSGTVYFPINTHSNLPISIDNDSYSCENTSLNTLHVTEMHSLFSNLTLYHKKHLENSELENADMYTRDELKEIWFHLRSNEILDKLSNLNDLRMDTIFKKKPMHSLYWLFKIYQWLYWLVLSYCYVEGLDTTKAEKVAEDCCKMAQELLNREKTYNSELSELSEEDKYVLCYDWNNINQQFYESTSGGMIFEKVYETRCKWNDRIPVWIKKIFTYSHLEE